MLILMGKNGSSVKIAKNGSTPIVKLKMVLRTWENNCKMRNQDLSTSALLVRKRRKFLPKVAPKEVPKENLRTSRRRLNYNTTLLKSAWFLVKLDHKPQNVPVLLLSTISRKTTWKELNHLRKSRFKRVSQKLQLKTARTLRRTRKKIANRYKRVKVMTL